MKTIPLTQGLEALVDDEDYEELSKYNWCAHRQRRTFYAVRRDPEIGNLIKMHQVVLGLRDGFDIDHEDRNGLNNQRYNLRHLTHAHNIVNSTKRDGVYSSRYKGVSYDKSRGQWAAYLWYEGVRQYLGRFLLEEEAAMAYDAAAVRSYGDIARLNFPKEK